MLGDRPKRVPDDFGRVVLRRLDRSGELEVLLGLLKDHEDYLGSQLQRMLASVPLTGDPAQLAAFQAAQGALAEVKKIIASWMTLARAPEPAPATGDGLERRLVDGTTRRRARVRL